MHHHTVTRCTEVDKHQGYPKLIDAHLIGCSEELDLPVVPVDFASGCDAAVLFVADRGLGDREAVDLEKVHGADRDVLDEVSAAVLHHDGALNLTWNLPQRTCRRCCGDWRDGCGRSDRPVGGIGR
jgi:hypothetical protein